MSIKLIQISALATVMLLFTVLRLPASDAAVHAGSHVQLAVAALENRFTANGVVVSIGKPSGRMQSFLLKIEKVSSISGFANLGEGYQGKEVEVLSEIGIPSSITVNKTVSVILRVSGDEWKQTLFFMGVVNNGSQK